MSEFDDLAGCVQENVSLADHTWFGLGGNVQYFAVPESVDQLSEIVKRCHSKNIPIRLLGAGSNVLVRDEGIPGMVISLSADAFTHISVEYLSAVVIFR